MPSFFVKTFVFFCVYYTVAISAHDTKTHPSDEYDSSGVPHHTDGVHNPIYDQEALFGKDAKRLGDLSPEEGLEQLRMIVAKMDEDKDGYVSSDELRAWLRKIQQRLMLTDAKRSWEEHGLQPDEKLTWELYSHRAVEKDGLYEDYDKTEQDAHLARDKMRWAAVDSDKDGQLSLEEATLFFNPELDPSMHDILTQETIDELDTNKDGVIDVNEYIADLWKPTESDKDEPDWVMSEREDFARIRDKNQDGKLDHAEVKEWRFPPDHTYVEAEVQHLLNECDTDKDGRLTEDEVLNRYDLFVGSAATNYGEVLTDHDEL